VTSSLSPRQVGVEHAPAARDAIGVLHLVAPSAVGGAERVVHALATGQRRAGHRVSVAAVLGRGVVNHPFVGPLVEAGVDVVPLRLPPRAYLRERAAIEDICRRFRPDVVHTHGYRVEVVDAGVAHRLGIPTVATVHGFTGGDWKNRLYQRLQRRVLRRFEAVVAVSRPLAGALARAGVPAERLHVVRNAWPEGGDGKGEGEGEPPLPRDRARRLLDVSPEQFHIGWVGRLTAEKGADVLIAALDSLRDVPLVVSVLGDGRLRPRLETQAARRGLGDRVRWFGNLPAARQLFSAFDVFVLSSRTEGTPIVLFEAMAAGAPIVATDVGGVPDVVSSKEALLVPPEDPASLAEAVRRVYADPTATALRARAARRRLEREFALEPWLASYERIYRTVQ
jgi:glycosyltransferase involved in cell wall biosynthesis